MGGRRGALRRRRRVRGALPARLRRAAARRALRRALPARRARLPAQVLTARPLTAARVNTSCCSLLVTVDRGPASPVVANAV